ncbi:MAG: site-2 protease family protein [Gemmatimonadota bacterium]|nr:site-2 protease family protein [Gemmatimonadota bacterium]
MSFDIERLLIAIPPILFALTFHEFAHAWSAKKLGDPTAENMGRLSLNPLVHLDPTGTIMIFITVMSGFGIGWAKPVPVDPQNLRNPRRDMLWIALAGPVSNLILAFVFTAIFTSLTPAEGLTNLFRQMLLIGISINLILAIFNMIPIPPLDGSKILMGLLPEEQARQYSQVEMYGPMLLIGLIVADQMLGLGIIRAWISIPMNLIGQFLFSLFS